jgi:outer membrane protein
MTLRIPLLALVAACASACPLAAGAAQGDWQVKLGVHVVDPKSDNGHLAGGALATDVDASLRPTVTLEYFVTPNIGVEVLAAWPFEHEIKLNGAKAATTRQLPPTVSAQWHFMPDAKVSPFVGLGVNYTRFFSIDETGPLTGSRLDLGDSWGLAAHAGVDIGLAPAWSLTLDARWIDIDTDVKVDGAKLGSVAIDPLVYGVAVGHTF